MAEPEEYLKDEFFLLPDYIREKIKIEGEHWLWVGAVVNRLRTHKQPCIRYGGRMRKATRVIYSILRKFDLNSKLQLNHKVFCNNSMCVNPEHVYLGTQMENILDKRKAGSYRSRYDCRFGHVLLKSPTTGHYYCPTCKNKRRDAWRQKQKEKKNDILDG